MIRRLDFKWFALICMNILLTVLVIAKNQPVIHSALDLSGLETRLSQIEASIDKPKEAVDLNPIHKNINHLQKLINELRNEDQQQIGEYFSSTQVALQNRIDHVLQLLNTMNDTKHPVKMLSPKALPFQVISIDSIQDESVASITYSYKTMALEQGDKLAGWEVKSVDFGKQIALFVNSKEEQVQISLKNHGDEHV